MLPVRTILGLLLAGFWLPVFAAAQQAPVWQPYRMEPMQPAAMGQIATDLPGPVVDALTDPELEILCGDCCESCPPPYTTPIYINAPYGDPVLAPLANAETWRWHLLPNDLLWHSYLAGSKESRISGHWFEETNSNTALLDVTLGGRSSVLRYGTYHEGRSEGWELQLEGAAILRLNLDNNWDFDLSDFRFGVPLIYARGNSQWKFSYYHLSSHLGDELAIRAGNLASRINYSRDVLVLGYSLFPVEALRLYAEMGYAFYTDGGSEPWEFQFGFDYSQPGPTGTCGTPFFAINGHLREEVDFGGNLSTQAGWLWRGKSGKVFRTGLQYYNGKSPQYQTFDEFEQQIGFGLWHDF